RGAGFDRIERADVFYAVACDEHALIGQVDAGFDVERASRLDQRCFSRSVLRQRRNGQGDEQYQHSFEHVILPDRFSIVYAEIAVYNNECINRTRMTGMRRIFANEPKKAQRQSAISASSAFY